MNLHEFDFPEVDKVNAVFSTFNTIPALLNEAKARGFLHGHTPYNKLFSELFFSGGKVKPKDDCNAEFAAKAWPYCQALMRSFHPKHEHKEAVCAMLMSEMLEPELDKS